MRIDMARARRGRGRPPKRKPPAYRLGQASGMNGDLWQLWLAHVLNQGPTWLYVCLLLTHCLCGRVTEILRLQKKDFDFANGTCYIKALKRGAPMRKPILSALLPAIKQLEKKGIKKKRTMKQGVRGEISYWDRWQWPSQPKGYLFPADRQDSRTKYRCKDTACKAVSRVRKNFKVPEHLHVNRSLIRTHSGRHRMINDCKRSAVPDEVGMHFARIVDKRTLPEVFPSHPHPHLG